MPSLARVCTEQEVASQAHAEGAKGTLKGHTPGTPRGLITGNSVQGNFDSAGKARYFHLVSFRAINVEYLRQPHQKVSISPVIPVMGGKEARGRKTQQ